MRRAGSGVPAWYWAVSLVAVVAITVGNTIVQALATVLTGVLAIAGIAVGVRAHRPRKSAVWWFYAAAMAATAVPQRSVPAGDTGGLLFAFQGVVSACGTIGATVVPLMLLRLRAGRRDREAAVDGLILTLAIAVVLRQVLTPGQEGLTVVPPVMIGVLTLIAGLTIAASIRLIFLAPQAISAYLILAAAIGGQAVGVVLAMGNGGGRIPMLAYVVAALTRIVVGAAALHPSMADLTRPVMCQPQMFYGRLLLLCAALPSCVLAVFVETGWRTVASYAGIGVSVVAVLVAFRLANLLREREHARLLQERIARIGARAFDETDEAVLLQEAADALAEALPAGVVLEVGVHVVRSPGAGTPANGSSVLRVPLVGHDVDHVVIHRRGRAFTPEELSCVDTFAVILSGALRRRRSEAAIRHAALHDGLTGLPNRELMVSRLTDAIEQADRPGQVALLFIDLDGFKGVNDRFGHDVGDELLVQAAGRMRATLRDGDFLARFAGDEFVLLATGPEEGTATEAVGRVRACLAEPFELHRGTVEIGGSVGLAVHDGQESAEDLLRRADEAMYAVKRNERSHRTEATMSPVA